LYFGAPAWVTVIFIEHDASHEVVGRQRQHGPLHLAVWCHLRGRSNEKTHLVLHGSHTADDVCGVRLVDECHRHFLRGNLEIGIALIAEEVRVGRHIGAEPVQACLAVQFDFRTLDVGNLAGVI
jgi:hypothetical protein